jgi:hypothetical protein
MTTRTLVAILALFGGVVAAPVSGPAAADPPCVDVTIGADQTAYYECLNDTLKRNVTIPDQRFLKAPLEANAQPSRIGTYSEAAQRMRLGNSFGKSAIPQRPAPKFGGPR